MAAGKFARGSKAWGHCNRCGFRFYLKEMVHDGQIEGLLVCTSCYDPKDPQEFLPPLIDPMALRHATGDMDRPPPAESRCELPLVPTTTLGAAAVEGNSFVVLAEPYMHPMGTPIWVTLADDSVFSTTLAFNLEGTIAQLLAPLPMGGPAGADVFFGCRPQQASAMDAMESDSGLLFGDLVTVLVSLSSTPYPAEIIEGMESNTVGPEWIQDVVFPPDAIDNIMSILSGEIRDPIVTYDGWPTEAMDSDTALLSGELRSPLVEYGMEPEAMESDTLALSGTMREALISYQEWPPEAVDSNVTIVSGSLT